MARKRKADVQEEPAVNRIQATEDTTSLQREAKEMLARNAKKSRESGEVVVLGHNDQGERTVNGVPVEDADKPNRKFGSLVRTSDHFASRIKMAASVHGKTIGEFCDDVLLDLVEALFVERAELAVRQLEAQYKIELQERLDHLRQLQAKNGPTN